MPTIYDYDIISPNGEAIPLRRYEGKALVIVNTATGCGFTPHYEPLEKMYRDYHERGLEMIDIPCNQFGGQAPGSDAEIHEFCTLHYNTTFPQMKKSDVNGPNALPLYGYLKSQCGFRGFGEGQMAEMMNDLLARIDPDFHSNPDIKWNFTKFVVDRKGNVVARFEPTDDIKELEKLVLSLL
ncbi:MAG: glutathione peroxidase [Erysipelotrichaceae bacterium]|nr:glutathione peroxidase [Erysipelotrichaceae bacterium]